MNRMKFLYFIIFISIFFTKSFAVMITDINLIGNERISKETIKVFGEITLNKNYNDSDLNSILKNLYDSNYFEDVKIKVILNKLNITVKEYPIIQTIFYNGIEAKKFVKIIEDNSRLKAKSPFNDYKLKQKINLKNLEKNFVNKNRFDNKKTSFVKFLLQKKLPEKIRKDCCTKLFKIFVSSNEKKFANNLYMTIKEIKFLKKNGMHIGAHGYDHLRLGDLNYKNQNEQIVKNMVFIKSVNGTINDWSICYPHGSYNLNTLKILKKLKCLVGFTIQKGKANLCNTEYLKLSRFDCNDFL